MSSTINLDDIPRPVWIGMMIVGFIIFWPIGLLILGYMIWSGKMMCGRRRDWQGFKARSGFGSTGNSAFDAYREETLKRLDEEAREFRDFVDRLRFAKDKEEFDRFMTERRAAASGATSG
ncbi:MAG: DUF2852 domain-containing protein [Hyphomicrobiaceae bacterium]